MEMKKRYIAAIIGGLAAGSVLLSGCSSTIASPLPNVIQVQNLDPAEKETISLSSSETVEVVPDMAEIVYGVTTEDADAAKCQQDNTEKLNQLLEYLKGQGYEETSIKTSGYSLDPRYDWNGGTQTLIGYEMRTQVTISDVPMEQVGGLISQGVANGANEIQSVAYFSSQYDEAYKEALQKAVELARSKAESLAAASGKELGQVLKIEEYGDYQTGRYVSAAKNMSAASGAAKEALVADMGVMPGEMEVTARISIEFEMYEMDGE